MDKIVDINVSQTIKSVSIEVTPNLNIINVNKVTNTPITNTSELINDGEDGINPFITLLDIPVSTNFVPYTGATSGVNLGEFGVQLGNLEFDLTPTNIPTTVGSLVWNDTDGTLDLKLKGGNTTLQIGQETVARVVNKTSTNITLLEGAYQAIRVTGAIGQRPKIDLALADNDLNSATTLGLVTETILNNAEGFITTSGQVREINTTGSLQGETWLDGDVLYLSGTIAGQITNIKPIAPIHTIIIGLVEYAHAIHGKIFVKVNNGYELEELHNVSAVAPNNNEVLAYDLDTTLWKPKTIISALGYTPVNNTLNIATTSPLQGGGDLSANKTLYILQSNTTTNGYLSSTDWNTFNNKQSALTNPITGIGTLNYLPKFTGIGSLGDSLIQDNGTNINVGTGIAAGKLTVTANTGSIPALYLRKSDQSGTSYGLILEAGTNNEAWVNFKTGTSGIAIFRSEGSVIYDAGVGGYISFRKIGGGGSTPMQISTLNNLLLGTTTDDGVNRLQVNGGTKITETVLAGSGALAGSALTINQTWNTTGSPTAISLNVTDTASVATSNLLNLQVGGVSKFKVDKTGRITTSNSVTGTDCVFSYNQSQYYIATTNNPSGKVGVYNYLNTISNVSNQRLINLNPTYNQTSGTASNTDIFLNRTTTAVGSGTQLLMDLQHNSVSQFSVTPNGIITATKLLLNQTVDDGVNALQVNGGVKIKALGALSTDIALRVIDSVNSGSLIEVNGLGQIGIGGSIDSGTLPSRIKINPFNNKIANIGNLSAATIPATLNDGDIYVYGNNLWLNSKFASQSLKGSLYKSMKLSGLQSDFFYPSATAKDFNQFSSTNYSTFGWGSLVHTGYSYGNTVMVNNPTSVGVDDRMYDGFLMSVNGSISYDPTSQLFVDIKGNIFARGNGNYAESDWKKALTDNSNKTTTVGSSSNYSSAKFAIDSTTKGFLPPRMTTVQINAIVSPAQGLTVFNTDLNTLCFYTTSWQKVTNSAM